MEKTMQETKESKLNEFCKTCGKQIRTGTPNNCDGTTHNTLMTWPNYEYCPFCGLNLHPEKDNIDIYGAKFCKSCGSNKEPAKKPAACLSHHPILSTIPDINYCIYCGCQVSS